jgi:hypothetical protein
LAFADRTQLTLFWRTRLASSPLPEPVRRRLDQSYADNTERLRRIRELAAAIEAGFTSACIDYVTLKGLSHTFLPDLRDRVQYDLDYFCPQDSVYRARDLLLGLGYEPLAGLEDFPTDHLPTLIRKTGWQWRGNFFDPDHPPAIELHFRFWDPATERIAAPGVAQFWDRRAGHALELIDQLGYAALHALRHLLRGSLRPAHLYEIACLLASDKVPWPRWRSCHSPELRALESVVFALARECFGCPIPEPPPPSAQAWLTRYAWSPIEALFHPNKHELILHLDLLNGAGDKWRVLRRRLAPLRLPGPVDAIHAPRLTPRLRLRRSLKYAAFLSSRVYHHARLLLPTLWSLLRR